MAYNKITNTEIQELHVQAQSDKLSGTAAQNKKVFDRLPERIALRFNEVVDLLNSAVEEASGAGSLGATPVGEGVAENVQGILEELNARIAVNESERHSHDNKETLDDITADNKSDYDRLVELLDGILGIVDTVSDDGSKLPTCKAIVNYVQQMGGGDMATTIYDPERTGKVLSAASADSALDAEKLDGKDPSEYADAESLDNHLTDSDIHVTASDKSTWNAKQDALIAGTNVTIEDNIISATGGFSPQIKANAPVGSSVTATKGETTLEATTQADGYAYIDVSEYGTWTIACSTSGKSTAVEVTEVKQYEVNVNYYKYGFRIKKSEPDPAARVEYLYDCTGYEPAKMNMSTHTMDYGSWEDYINSICRPVMLKYDGTVGYELNHLDQTKKLDGSASDVTNTSYAGNAMVEFKRIYTKEYEEDGYEYVIMSDHKLDSDYQALGFVNGSGYEVEAAYWGMYTGSNVSSRLRSIAGQSVMVNQTASTEETYAKANNTAGGLTISQNGDGWYIGYKSLWDVINNLLVLITKSTDNQGTLGYGRCKSTNSSGTTPGTLKGYGAFWGSDDQTSQAKCFYIEDFWGNYWQRMAGWVLNGTSGQMVKLSPPYAAPSNSAGAYSGYHQTGIVPGGTSGTAVNVAVRGPYGYLPKTASGSDTTYECDAMWFATNQVDYALVGGYWSYALRAGGRCAYLAYLASDTDSALGARLSFIPQ